MVVDAGCGKKGSGCRTSRYNEEDLVQTYAEADDKGNGFLDLIFAEDEIHATL